MSVPSLRFSEHLQNHDGLDAVAKVATAFADVCFFYELYAGEYEERIKRASVHQPKDFQGKKIKALQITAGAASALHGVLTGGCSASLLAPSQALPEMFPTMTRVARKRLPTVFHVAAQSLSDDLAVRADHRDIMAVRDVGFGILFSDGSAQEGHDIATAAHLASVQVGLPLLHVFDGWNAAARRVSAPVPNQLSDKLFNAVSEEPRIPISQVADHIDGVLAGIQPQGQVKGYRAFEYCGATNAEVVVVILAGAASVTMEKAVPYLEGQDGVALSGLLKVRLYRPWASRLFLEQLPATAKRVVVIELVGGDARNRQASSIPPLVRDVTASLRTSGRGHTKVVSVQVGAVSEFSLPLAKAIWHRVQRSSSEPLASFTVNSDDDLLSQLYRSDGFVDKTTKQCIFWDSPMAGVSSSIERSGQIISLLSQSGGKLWAEGHHMSDAYNPKGSGAVVTHLRFGPATDTSFLRGLPSSIPPQSADYVACHDPSLLWKDADSYNPLEGLKKNGSFLLSGSSSDIKTLETQLSAEVRHQLWEKTASFYVLDTCHASSPTEQQLLLRTAFFVIGLSSPSGALFKHKDLMLLFELNPEIVRETIGALTLIDIPESWRAQAIPTSFVHRNVSGSLLPPSANSDSPATGEHVGASSLSLSPRLRDGKDAESSDDEDVQQEKEAEEEEEPKREGQGTARLESRREDLVNRKWREACWALIFGSKLGTRKVPAAQVAESGKIYQLRVRTNKRLTPTEYERNVFHLEFELGDSGMQYKIGDALGVAGHNDPKAVAEFLEFYGIHPQQVVELTPPERRRTKDSTAVDIQPKVELRTAAQAFESTLDIFGRPAKSFYESLARIATDPKEQEHLEWLISPAGGEEYKRRVAECVTFADLLKEFKSARPPVAELLRLIPRIKMRVYSIASSNSMHPDSVHLLVVTHTWETPSGTPKIGQCTRFLEALRPGDIVATALKPSIMQLPPLTTQPIIMAGLGTGMAPFRAFIEERAWQKSQGMEVGPMALYFGSRSRYSEYLYGEELEAYHWTPSASSSSSSFSGESDSGDPLLTYLRLAFSRDQPKKEYIQHKLAEDSVMLHDWLVKRDGVFYLCGPTWPVPDIKKTLVESFVSQGEMHPKVANNTLEQLKKEGRYVLEVY